MAIRPTPLRPSIRPRAWWPETGTFQVRSAKSQGRELRIRLRQLGYSRDGAWNAVPLFFLKVNSNDSPCRLDRGCLGVLAWKSPASANPDTQRNSRFRGGLRRGIRLLVLVLLLSDQFVPDRLGLLLRTAERLVRASQLAVCLVRHIRHYSPQDGRQGPLRKPAWAFVRPAPSGIIYLPSSRQQHRARQASETGSVGAASSHHVGVLHTAKPPKHLAKIAGGDIARQIAHTDIHFMPFHWHRSCASRWGAGRRETIRKTDLEVGDAARGVRFKASADDHLRSTTTRDQTVLYRPSASTQSLLPFPPPKYFLTGLCKMAILQESSSSSRAFAPRAGNTLKSPALPTGRSVAAFMRAGYQGLSLSGSHRYNRHLVNEKDQES